MALNTGALQAVKIFYERGLFDNVGPKFDHLRLALEYDNYRVIEYLYEGNKVDFFKGIEDNLDYCLRKEAFCCFNFLLNLVFTHKKIEDLQGDKKVEDINDGNQLLTIRNKILSKLFISIS